MDLGCPRTVSAVIARDPHLMLYSSEYSNSNSKKSFKKLASDDETHYDKRGKVSVSLLHTVPLLHDKVFD